MEPHKKRRPPLQIFQNEASTCDVLCGCIVAASFVLYLRYYLTHTLVYSYDWQKQFLIANHIARFRELPVVGDELSVFFGLHITSPLYYYLYALVVWLDDNMLFAAIAWLTLSMAGVVCIYLIGKEMFSPAVGVFACALFAFSYAFAQQLERAQNVAVGRGLLYVSFLLLVRAHRNKKIALALWAIATYCIASIIYSGGFGVLPIFALLAAVTLKKQHASARHYLGAVAVAGFVLIAAYLPVIIHAYSAHLPMVGSGVGFRFVHSPRTFLRNLTAHTIYSTDGLFLIVTRDSKFPPLSSYATFLRRVFFCQSCGAGARVASFGSVVSLALAGLVGISLVGYFLLSTKPPEKKRWSVILICSIAAVLLTAALLNFLYYATWHYMAIQGLQCILVSEATTFVWIRFRVPRMVGVVFSGLLVWCLAGGFAGISMLESQPPAMSASLADAAGEEMVHETAALRSALSEPNFRPQLKEYEIDGRLSNGDPYLWMYLENAFDERFVKLTDQVSAYGVSYDGYEPVGDDRYIFVICRREMCPQNWKTLFSSQYKQYKIMRDLIKNAAYEVILVSRI